MTLPPGTLLGPYEIVSLLGAGGMGEVYRARDSRLQRDVALKVLPEAFARDHERLWRFEREARVLASLNHPNIAHVHGLEDSGTSRALVMELVEGQTLADRIAQGPLPFEDARAIAVQIAEALETAHDAGIIHRDLKPANIKIRGERTVKVLDFGLAKALDGASGSQIETGGATRSGVVLGTVAYMSPEQARGKPIDKRTDIWAYGCVLYEMLSGQRLFAGESASDTLAAVLTADIDLARLPGSVPPHVRRILERCLDRDPKTRLRDIGEARVALSADSPVLQSEPVSSPRSRNASAARIAPLIVLAAIAGAAIARWYPSRNVPPAPAYRFQIPTPPMLDLTDFDVSPDGRTLAFVALSDSQAPMVWVRPLDAAGATVLPGTEGARGVFWSSDSRTVGYAVNRQLRRQPLQGGPAQPIGAVNGQFVGAAWQGDTIVFASYPAGLMRLPASGGEPVALTTMREGERLLGRPFFLADGRHFVYQAYGDTRAWTCGVSLDDPAVRCEDTDTAIVGLVPPGRALSLRGGSLFVAPFDASALTSAGSTATVVGEDLHLRSAGNRAAVSYSPAGVLAFRQGAEEERQLVWFDRSGVRGEAIAAGSYDNFDLSPDGARVLAAGSDATGSDILSMIDVARGVVTRVVAGERGWTNDPVWSPDGKEFAYLQRSDRSRIVVRPVDGGAARTVYEASDELAWVEDWSRDGRYLAVGVSTAWRQPRVLLVPTGGGAPREVPTDRGIVDEYQFSPDGKWLAYNSDASGQQEIYVTPLPPTGERWQVSSKGGVQPRWRRDGRELFYIAPDNTMMSVSIAEGARFKPSAPGRLFTLPQGLGSPIFDEYAVSADGRGFLVAEPIRGRGVQPITVIVNWSPPDR